jgi:hypothetical protein
MKNLYLSFLFIAIFSGLGSRAQFSGSYAPVHWSKVLSAGSNGTVNTAGVPASIVITGSNDASNTLSPAPVNTDYTVTVPSSGIWSFTWSYHTNDVDASPEYDVAGILINGSFTQLTNNAGGIDQGGTYTAPFVTAGTVIGFRISAIDNAYGNASFSISGFAAPNNTLPVKLTTFDATPQGSKVLLQWHTASEINTSHFEVERSANGSSFNAIGSVAAQNAPGSHAYSFTDASPVGAGNYYRLRMVDLDGTFSYSAIAYVKLGTSLGMDVYPNPAHDQLTLTLVAEKPGKETVQIFDATGKLIKSLEWRLVTGVNKTQLKIVSLNPGTYFIKTNNLVTNFIKE